MTIQYDRQLIADFPDLPNNLQLIWEASNNDGKEHMVFVFDDDVKMEVIGTDGMVTHTLVKAEYTKPNGLSLVYGEDLNTFGRVNYSRIKYSAHTHPLVSKENEQGRPSGKDVSRGAEADYGVTKTLMGNKPHYVISPTHIYCINYTKDSRTITSYRTDIRVPITPVDMEVSFAGKWNWSKAPDGVITYIYVSDDHYVPEELSPAYEPPNVIIENTGELKDFENIEGGIIIDESGTTIQTNQTYEK